MKQLCLKWHMQARVWPERLSDLTFVPVGNVTRDAAVQPSLISQSRFVAVELFAPSGPRSQTGLLGGLYVPDAEHNIHIQVNYSRTIGNVLEWALASKVDEVRAGLPQEYADAVLTGASSAVAKLGAGQVQFNCAAHGVIGSSPAIFAKLAVIVVDLLNNDPENLSTDLLTQIIEENF